MTILLAWRASIEHLKTSFKVFYSTTLTQTSKAVAYWETNVIEVHHKVYKSKRTLTNFPKCDPQVWNSSFPQGTGKSTWWSKIKVTTSRATSGGWRKDRNTSGQRVNKFNNSYSHISVIFAENNSLLKPKCQQYISLNKMLSNFSKVLMAHISFTAVINNGGIGKGIGGIWKDTKKNYIYVL